MEGNHAQHQNTSDRTSLEDNTNQMIAPIIQINRPQNEGMDSTEAVMQVPTDENNSFVGMRVSSGLPFPFKLHAMLDNATDGGYETIVSWSGENGFLVHDKDAFVADIIPKYFSQTKYRSFQRLLNMWGFQRLREGPRKGAYYHEQFQRGNPSLCGSMKCEKIKNKAPPSSSSSSTKKAKDEEPKKSTNEESATSESKEMEPPANVPEKKVVTFDQATKPGSEVATTTSAPLPSFEDTFGGFKQIIPVGKSKSSDNHRYADVFDPKQQNGKSEPLPTYSDLFEDRQFHEVSNRDKIARVYGPNGKEQK